ncbi:MAG: hypothetical protein ACR2KE_03075 [Candidatus Nanopelagicales bacterium]
MGRMIWVALGAAGGVYAYRRGQRLLDEARERGVVGSMQAATGSAAGLAAQARTLLQAAGGTGRPAPAPAPVSSAASGAAAARVLAQSRGSS